MGQTDVYNWLKKQRVISDGWHTVKDIKKGLQAEGHSNGVLHNVHNNIYRLVALNHIMFKGVGLWKHEKLFRAKKY